MILPHSFRSPIAIKIDVDGIELQILEGLREMLSAKALRYLMVEEAENESNVASLLAPYGFRLSHQENTTPMNPGTEVNRFFAR